MQARWRRVPCDICPVLPYLPASALHSKPWHADQSHFIDSFGVIVMQRNQEAIHGGKRVTQEGQRATSSPSCVVGNAAPPRAGRSGLSCPLDAVHIRPASGLSVGGCLGACLGACRGESPLRCRPSALRSQAAPCGPLPPLLVADLEVWRLSTLREPGSAEWTEVKPVTLPLIMGVMVGTKPSRAGCQRLSTNASSTTLQCSVCGGFRLVGGQAACAVPEQHCSQKHVNKHVPPYACMQAGAGTCPPAVQYSTHVGSQASSSPHLSSPVLL